MCLAQGHNAVMLEKFEPTALRSRVKHSTTEPLHSHDADVKSRRFQEEKNFDGIRVNCHAKLHMYAGLSAAFDYGKNIFSKNLTC